MKKASFGRLLFFVSLFLTTTNLSFASDLDCFDVNGMSIFGYDNYEDEYVYIGSIANEFNSDSIGNEFGSYGNEFNSDSIFNEYGDYGSEYSSESAFNEYASTPPILINSDDEFVGYLSLNEYKTPSINPWAALACSKDSFKSPISGHEDIKFTDIPSSSGLSDAEYLYLQYLLQQSATNTCLDTVNGFLGDDNKCYCNSGYHWDDSTNLCAQDKIVYKCGLHSSINKNNECICNSGYIWKNNDSNNFDCIKQEATPVVTSPSPGAVFTPTSNSDVFQFTDIAKLDPNRSAIIYLYDKGIISGYADGTFKPDNSINRAELLKILIEAQDKTPSVSEYKDCFKDVKQEWFAPYVCYAKNEGWVDGYSDGTFAPAKTINKVEALKMLLNSRGMSPGKNDVTNVFSDVDENSWYSMYVGKAYNLGIISERGNTYVPNDNMTRGNMSNYIYRLLTLSTGL